jgi:antitoxin (DNA-binding transcriptional repressor) of toxin-antitoxin stability system
MATPIPFNEAEHQLGRLVDEAEHGEEVLIEKDGRVFKLVEIKHQPYKVGAMWAGPHIHGQPVIFAGLNLPQDTRKHAFLRIFNMRQTGRRDTDIYFAHCMNTATPDAAKDWNLKVSRLVGSVQQQNVQTAPSGVEGAGKVGEVLVVADTPPKRKVVFGSMKGRIKVAPNFDDTDEESAKLFEGAT